MEKRYQVFVSSTYEDLKEERQEVMHALLELNCIPSGMELFPAANETQWSVITKVIGECDYYILILAGRYGSCGPDGLGYTEIEYQYALSIGKPTIAFLHEDPGNIQSKKCESTQEGKEKLVAFRSIVEQKLCKHWSTRDNLGAVVSRSMTQLIKNTPAVGWVRADELPSKDAMLELLKLRKQVEELESELARARTTAPKGSEDLAQGREFHFIRYSFRALNLSEIKASDESDTFPATWDSIFAAVAPLMINEASDFDLFRALNDFVRDQNSEELLEEEHLAGCSLDMFQINRDDFQTIKVQLRALGLIAKSEKSKSPKDTETYWTLTPYGDNTMTRLRAIKRTGDSTMTRLRKIMRTVVPEEKPKMTKGRVKDTGKDNKRFKRVRSSD